MNEFVNHQLARNTIFIEVENRLDESVFNLLFEKYPHVLHNPNIDEYYKYAGELLVDLFGRGISGAIISRSEYRAIYEDSFKKYNINLAKMFRYARRRGIEQRIRNYICEETSITLEDAK